MPADGPVNAEIVARLAMAEKSAGTTPTPEQAEANILIAKQEKEGTMAGLKVAAERLDGEKVSRANEKAIGTTRNEDGKIDRTGDEKTRHTDATDSTKKIETFLDKGYDDADVDQAFIDGRILNIVNSVPALKTLYDNSSDKTDFIKRIARNPGYAHLVYESANGILDPSKIKAETISAIQADITAADARIKEINDKLTDGEDNLEGRIKTLTADLKEISEGGEVDDGGVIKKATKVDRMRGNLSIISSRLAPLEKEIKNLQRLQDSFESALDQAEAEGKKGDDTIAITINGVKNSKKVSEFRTIFENNQNVIEQRNSQYSEWVIQKTALESRITRYDEGDYEKNLKKDLEDARKEKKDLEKEKKDLKVKLVKNKIELIDAKDEREFEEKDYVRKLDNVFSEAAQKYIDQRLKEAETTYRNNLTAEAANSKDVAMAHLKDMIGDQLFDANGKIKKSIVESKLDEMLKLNDPSVYLTDLLKMKGKDGTVKLTDNQIEDLKKDPSKWKELQLELGKELIGLYSTSRGWGEKGQGTRKLQEMALKLKHSSWGAEAMANGLESSRKDIESLTGIKMPDRSKIGEWLKKQDSGKWALFLSIIGIAAALLLIFGLKH